MKNLLSAARRNDAEGARRPGTCRFHRKAHEQSWHIAAQRLREELHLALDWDESAWHDTSWHGICSGGCRSRHASGVILPHRAAWPALRLLASGLCPTGPGTCGRRLGCRACHCRGRGAGRRRQRRRLRGNGVTWPRIGLLRTSWACGKRTMASMAASMALARMALDRIGAGLPCLGLSHVDTVLPRWRLSCKGCVCRAWPRRLRWGRGSRAKCSGCGGRRVHYLQGLCLRHPG